MRKFLVGVLIGMALYSSMMICKNNAERKYKDEIEEIKKIQQTVNNVKAVKENFEIIEIEELEVVEEYDIALAYNNLC
jgi:hypothetical protein